VNRKLTRVIVLGLASLAAAFALIGSEYFLSATASAAAISGTGTLSGKVEASKPFQAAQVYAKNLDNNMLFVVYTVGGKYEAVNLLPGNYEVSVKKNGFSANPKKITITAGANATADFTLSDAPLKVNRTTRGAEGPNGPSNVPAVSYEELYPPGAGRTLIEKNCMLCHGYDFVPSHQWDADQWNAAIDLMSDPTAMIPGRIVPGTFSGQERQDLVAYLVQNYGPNSTPRALAVPEMPVDEASVAKAMFVEYPIPVGYGRPMHDDHFDKDGNIWFTERAAGHPSIGMVDPRTGVFKDYPIPNTISFPHGITLDGAGDLWWVGDLALGRVNAKTGEMTLYPFGVQATAKQNHGHTPVVDSKQNVWFTQSYPNQLGKWDRETGKITEYKVPTAFGFAYGLAIDKQDNLWIAEWTRCKVAKFDQETEAFIEYTPLTRPCTMRRLSVDSDGKVWYALDSRGKIGKLDPLTGKIVEYTIPVKYSYPYDIQPDHEGKLWISDSGQGGALIHFDPKTSKFVYFPSPQRTDMPKIEILRDGAILYTNRSAYIQSVGVMYPDKTKMTSLGAYH
jgi:virginiamycin B lyase